MRKTFLTLSSAMKRKRLRRLNDFSKRKTRLKHRQNASVVDRCSDPSGSEKKAASREENCSFGQTQRTLVFVDSDVDSPSITSEHQNSGHVKGRKKVVLDSGESKRGGRKGKQTTANEGCSSVGVGCRKPGKTVKNKRQRKDVEGCDKKGGNDEPPQVTKGRKRSKKDEFAGIRTRSSPVQFYNCVRVLTEGQRNAVKEMGFGRLLGFSVGGIPAKLGYFVVDNFNPKKMEISTPSGKIKVTRKVIHQILGIPFGGKKFKSMERMVELDDAVADWKSRYPGVYVPPTKMVKMIDESDGEDSFNFRMDFLMCFVAVLVDCHKQSCLREEILQYITEDMNFAEMDWCDFVLQKLKTCKQSWDRSNPQSFFVGPLTILILLYVESISCVGMDVDKSVCPLAFWTVKRLRERERLEIISGGFGLGPFKGLPASKEYKVDQGPNREENVMMLRNLVELILRNKKKVEGLLDKMLVEHPQDEDVQTLKSKYESILDQRPQWTMTNEDPFQMCTDQINNVLSDLGNDEREHSSEEGDDGPLSDESPIASLYRKSLNRKRGLSKRKAANIESSGNVGCVNVGDFDEAASAGTTGIEMQNSIELTPQKLRRSPRFESSHAAGEIAVLSLTPKRRKTNRKENVETSDVVKEKTKETIVSEKGKEGTSSASKKMFDISTTTCTSRAGHSDNINLDIGNKDSHSEQDHVVVNTTDKNGEVDGYGEDIMKIVEDDVGIHGGEMKLGSEVNVVVGVERPSDIEMAYEFSEPVKDQVCGNAEVNGDGDEMYKKNVEENVDISGEPGATEDNSSIVELDHDAVGKEADVGSTLSGFDERQVKVNKGEAAHTEQGDEESAGGRLNTMKCNVYACTGAPVGLMGHILKSKNQRKSSGCVKGTTVGDVGAKAGVVDGPPETEISIVSVSNVVHDGLVDTRMPDGEEMTGDEKKGNGMEDAVEEVNFPGIVSSTVEVNVVAVKGKSPGELSKVVDTVGITVDATNQSADGAKLLGACATGSDVESKTTPREEGWCETGEKKETEKSQDPLVEVGDKQGKEDSNNISGPSWSLGMTQEGSGQEGQLGNPVEDPLMEKDVEVKNDGNLELSLFVMVDPISSYDPATSTHRTTDKTKSSQIGVDQEDRDDNMSLAQRSKLIAELNAKRRNPVREKVVAEPNRSPYIIRFVDISEPLNKKDTAVWDYISMDEGWSNTMGLNYSEKKAVEQNRLEQGELAATDIGSGAALANEWLFKSPKGVTATRALLKTLKVGEVVSGDIIACWVEVLNFQERRKARESPSRLFVNPSKLYEALFVPGIEGEEKRARVFASVMKGAVPNKENEDLRNFDIVMFPVIEHETSAYLLVFELREPYIYVIDNDKGKGSVEIADSVYYVHKHLAYQLKEMFVRYLRDVGNPKADEIEECIVFRQPVPWATIKSTSDCGVFLMRHMEGYMGRRQGFQCGFSTCGSKKVAEVRKLRKKYAASLLFSEVNVLLPKVQGACRIR